jgi:hypothetical protein
MRGCRKRGRVSQEGGVAGAFGDRTAPRMHNARGVARHPGASHDAHPLLPYPRRTTVGVALRRDVARLDRRRTTGVCPRRRTARQDKEGVLALLDRASTWAACATLTKELDPRFQPSRTSSSYTCHDKVSPRSRVLSRLESRVKNNFKNASVSGKSGKYFKL